MIALILDDNRSLAGALARGLAQHGWSVVRHTEAEHAIEWLESYQADVIVTDVSMPGVSGVEALPELRRVSEAPIVALTGHDPEREDIAAAGFDRVMRKPIEMADLVRTLAEVCGR